MAITNESKQTLKAEIEKLEFKKSKVIEQIDRINLQKDKLLKRKQSISDAIIELKKDSY